MCNKIIHLVAHCFVRSIFQTALQRMQHYIFPEVSGRSDRLHNKPFFGERKGVVGSFSKLPFLFSISSPLNSRLMSTAFNWAPSCRAGEHIRDDVSLWLSEDLPGNISRKSPGQLREIKPVSQSTGAQKKNGEEDEEERCRGSTADPHLVRPNMNLQRCLWPC